jgi:glutaminase
MLDAPDNKNLHSATSTDEMTPWLGSQIQKTLDNIYEKYKHVDKGDLATYIPELCKADPSDFGICLATAEGEVFMAGDWEKEFTIQSVCKPFAFQMALEQHGVEEVLKHVGVEPSGDAFNAIELDERKGAHSTRW